MKPEEILYNTVLEIDPNYGISLEEFTANLYQNEGYLLELDESVRGFDDETNKALDQVKINLMPEVEEPEPLEKTQAFDPLKDVKKIKSNYPILKRFEETKKQKPTIIGNETALF